MYAPYRNYDAALGAVVPATEPGMVIVPMADVLAQLTRLGVATDRAGIPAGLALVVPRLGLTGAYFLGAADVRMPAAMWNGLMALPPAAGQMVVDSKETWWEKHWPLVTGAGLVVGVVGYLLLRRPQRVTRNRRRRRVRRNSFGHVRGGQKKWATAARKAYALMELTGKRVEWGYVPAEKAWLITDEQLPAGVISKHSWSPRGKKRSTALARNGRRGVPRVGTRVTFEAHPASLPLYSHPPRHGEQGTVTTVSFGSAGKRSYLPGPGGGLVYVDWDETGVQGVSPIDVHKMHRGAQTGYGGRYKKGGGRT